MNKCQEDRLRKLKGELTLEQRISTGMQAVLDRTRHPAPATVDKIIKLAGRIADQNRRQTDGSISDRDG